jgi:hypothetical protein
MTTDLQSRNGNGLSPATANALWVALIAALTIGGSFVYACAAPFAAIAALAATKMDRANGLSLVAVAWIVNQAVGFGLLDYPLDASTFAWGGAIGLGTVAGFAAARAAVATVSLPLIVMLAVAFTASFVVYELALYAASFVLGASDAAFSMDVVGYILRINAVSFAGLLLLHRAAVALAWISEPAQPVPAQSPAAA